MPPLRMGGRCSLCSSSMTRRTARGAREVRHAGGFITRSPRCSRGSPSLARHSCCGAEQQQRRSSTLRRRSALAAFTARCDSSQLARRRSSACGPRLPRRACRSLLMQERCCTIRSYFERVRAFRTRCTPRSRRRFGCRSRSQSRCLLRARCMGLPRVQPIADWSRLSCCLGSTGPARCVNGGRLVNAAHRSDLQRSWQGPFAIMATRAIIRR